MSPSYLAKIALGGVALLGVAAPANAFAASHGDGTRHHPAKSAPHPGKEHHGKEHPGKKHHGNPKTAHFTAAGVVRTVDAASGVLTMDDKGGSPDLHGKTVTVTVGTTTKITRDDADASLAQVQVGDHIMANGTRADGGVLNAMHLNASSTPRAKPTSTPTANPTPSPTVTPTTAATPTNSANPTATH